MGLYALIIIAVAVSLDGFWGGFAFGLRKIKISFLSLLIIAFCPIVCTMITMLIGARLKSYIPLELGKYIGAGLLFLLGAFTMREGCKNREGNSETKNKIKVSDLLEILNDPLLADIDRENDIKPIEAILLGMAVAMDASIAAFTLSLAGFNPFLTPFLFGLTHFLLVGFGNIISRQNLINSIAKKFSMLPGIILIVMAILRLI